MIGKSVVAVVAVAAALGGIAASADAAVPRLGRWDGRAGSARVVFTVEQNARHRRFVVRPVFYCGPAKFSFSEVGLVQQFDAWRISATGRFPVGSAGAPFRGRFGAERGTFTAQDGLFCPGAGTRFTARWDPAAPVVRDGSWSVSSKPQQRPELLPDRFATFGEGSLIESTWSAVGGAFCVYNAAADMLVSPDGSFEETIPSSPGVANFDTFQVSGRFLSGGTATGTYTLTGPGCSGQPVTWTATLATPYPAPRPAGTSTRLEPPGKTPHRRVINYVALGDSYSSGHGVPPYDPGTNIRGKGPKQDICHRSKYAYSRVLQIPHFELRRSFFACSGATTANVTRVVQYPGEHVDQLGHTAALRAADLVTITIGGNDVRFDQVLKNCIRGSHTCNHTAILNRAKGVEPKLISTYAAIRAAVPATAAVIALDYPQLFPKQGLPARCEPDRLLFTRGTQRFLRRAASLFDTTIADAARRAGVQFVDVRPIFAGHEICGRHGGWLNHIEPPSGPPLAVPGENSVHPNRAGQAAYARAIAHYIRARIAAHAPLTPAGLPADPPPQG